MTKPDQQMLIRASAGLTRGDEPIALAKKLGWPSAAEMVDAVLAWRKNQDKSR